MLDKPEVVQSKELITAVIHITIPRAEIRLATGAAIAEAMAAQGIAPAGPLFSYHPKKPSDVFDFELGFPINTATANSGRVKASKLPSPMVARTNYRGNYEGLGEVWCAFFNRITPRIWMRRVACGNAMSPARRAADPAIRLTEFNSPLMP